MELQATWVAKVLSGTVELPSREVMADSVQKSYSEMGKIGSSKHPTHSLQNDEVEYVSWLAAKSDKRLPRSWKKITFNTIVKRVLYYGENYRDIWAVDKWIREIDSSL
ncbi:hypothetical protein F3Y22_tig00016563pilonHSYRG00099 [Hibiscus syriacus]|uniref:Flavin-containing monooxygenase n=1 Tax=Hibiscus syriacus TaxID=106335 RepID=A0A6A3BWQ6_HIBSY|nr:hypothetical protein F3Y22_tig00016563pilonHSYRG00099 [Hibiscus syriacus]